MITLRIPDMHCENCVKRITGALTAAKLSFEVSLPDRAVEIEGSEASAAAAKAAIAALGYTVEG